MSIDISKRTKGEWVIKKRGIAANEVSFYNTEGEYIGMFSHAIDRPALMKEAKEKGKANAAFICLAVNNYESLKKTNAGLMNALKNLIEVSAYTTANIVAFEGAEAIDNAIAYAKATVEKAEQQTKQ